MALTRQTIDGRGAAAALEDGGARAALAPVRVLYANAWSSCHGGSSTSLLDIVKHLDRRRFEPIVLCPEPGLLPDRLRESGVPVVLHGMTALNKTNGLRFCAETLWYRKLLRREGIGLVHSNVGGWRRSYVAATKWCGIPYIQHVRNEVRSGLKFNFSYAWARRIITNSDANAGPLLSDARYRDKTLTVYNGVDLSLYESRDSRRDELGAGSRPIVGFVGQLIPRKGVSTLIEAVHRVRAEIPDVLLVIVGCSPPDEGAYERECRALAKTLGMESSVVFAGYRRDVPSWMRTFDVFALPTREEPFGKVVVEAMAAGAPVVATRVGGIPEIVPSLEFGSLVVPDDPAGTAEAIRRYLVDPRLARSVGNAGAARARELFGLESMVRRLEGIYDEVLSEPRPGRVGRALAGAAGEGTAR